MRCRFEPPGLETTGAVLWPDAEPRYVRESLVLEVFNHQGCKISTGRAETDDNDRLVLLRIRIAISLNHREDIAMRHVLGPKCFRQSHAALQKSLRQPSAFESG